MVNGVRHRSSLTHPELVINRTQGALSRGRRLHVVQGISGTSRTLKINDPDIDTLACALLERVYYHEKDGVFSAPRVPEESHVFSTLRRFRGKLLARLDAATPVSPEEFSEMYRGRKFKIYQRAALEYMTIGVRRSDAVSDAFVKCEKVPHNKAPRCIQPRKVVYNVGVGRFLKPLEHIIYKAIQSVYGSATPVVVKGFNAVQTAEILLAKAERFKRPIFVGLDASRFDQHVSTAMLRWEHSIYNAVFRSKELRRLLGWQLKNRGRGFCDDGVLRYRCDGRRLSGDMNTALGNCLIMCAMVYAYAEERGIEIDLANNGDDCVVFMEAEDEQRFAAGLHGWFDELGFVMTVEPTVHEYEKIEFCQQHPIRTGNGVVMCRNLDKSREKDTMILNDVSTETAYRKWLKAVGDCGLAIASGVPVFQEMYSCYSRFGLDGKVQESVQFQSGFLFMGKGLHPRITPVTEEARYSFYLAFGVSPDEQRELENYYAGLDLSGFEVDDVELLEEIMTAPF